MKTPSGREFWLVALLLLIAATLFWLCLLPRQATGSAIIELPPLSMQWRPGTVQHYRFIVDSLVRVQTDGVAATAPTSHNVRGVLAIKTLAIAADSVSVRMQLDPVELSVAGVVDSESSRALGCVFQVRCSPGGMPIDFAFPESIDPEQAQLLEQLVRTFQLEVRSECTWQAEESHGSGTYLASYRRVGVDQVERTKLRYVGPPAGAPAEVIVQVLAAEATVRLEPDLDWLRTSLVHEVLSTTTELGLTVVVTTDAELTKLCDAEVVAARVGRARAAPSNLKTEVALATADAQRRPAITARPAAELAAELNELVAALDGLEDGRATLVHRLRDLLRADHRAPAMLLLILQQQELQVRTRANLFLAFELGGTAACQAALCQVAADMAWRRGDRTRALVALGGLAQPTDASLTALWATANTRSSEQARDHANTAALALGALGSRMDHSASADYAVLRGGLLAAALGARDDRARAIAILALGNTGDASLDEDVAQFLDDGAPGVRRAAAKALGKYGTEQTAVELMLRLRQEPSSGVRAAMAGALARCATAPPESMPIVREAIAGEQDDLARLGLARFLARDLAGHPDNVTALRQLLIVERSRQVRRFVGEALAVHDASQRRALGR